MAKDTPEKITIIGLGLIGGSIGLALKNAKLDNVTIVGHDADPETGAKARRRGAVDDHDWNLLGAVKGASLIILATPVLAVRDTLPLIANHLEDGCVVTDTASTKQEVMRWAAEFLPESVHFVGGHPMAGRELQGIDGADPTLFDNATYCVFPSPAAHPAAVQAIIGLISVLGAKPYFLDPLEHDGYVAGVSHLPMIAAAALVGSATRQPSWREMRRVAASGFRDTTRLASGEPTMARDILVTNRENIVRWIDQFIDELKRFRALAESDPEEIQRAFAESKDARDRWIAGVAPEDGPSAFDELPSFGERMRDMVMGERLSRLGRKFEKRK